MTDDRGQRETLLVIGYWLLVNTYDKIGASMKVRYSFLDAGYLMLDTGYWVLGIRYWRLDDGD